MVSTALLFLFSVVGMGIGLCFYESILQFFVFHHGGAGLGFSFCIVKRSFTFSHAKKLGWDCVFPLTLCTAAVHEI